MTARAALRLLAGLPNYEQLDRRRMVCRLEPLRSMLKALGSPEQRLRNVALVAGTKGKGSVCCLLESVLRAAGYRTALYTSPHLLDVRERIRISGVPVPARALARCVGRLGPVLRTNRVTWFEALTAAAFLHFADADPDYTILEVGLGGRCDATNTVDPLLSVITRIGHDHTEVLGRTLRLIAGEKSGIMRRRGTALLSRQPAPALAALRAAARALHARLIYAPSRVRLGAVRVLADGTEFRTVGGRVPNPESGAWRIGLAGRHQAENARVVLAIALELRRLGHRLHWTEVDEGLRRARLRARCEVIRSDPLLVIDSAHNPESIQALVDFLADHGAGRVTFIVGFLRDKPAARLLRMLRPAARRFILVEPDSPRACSVTELAALARDLGLDHETRTRLDPAWFRLGEPVVVTGSFYLAGQALRLLGLRS